MGAAGTVLWVPHWRYVGEYHSHHGPIFADLSDAKEFIDGIAATTRGADYFAIHCMVSDGSTPVCWSNDYARTRITTKKHVEALRAQYRAAAAAVAS